MVPDWRSYNGFLQTSKLEETASHSSITNLITLKAINFIDKVKPLLYLPVRNFITHLKIVQYTNYSESELTESLTIIGRLGGDSKLTPRGEEFAKKLGDYVNQLQHPNFKVWTSWLTRTIDTAEYIDFQQER